MKLDLIFLPQLMPVIAYARSLMVHISERLWHRAGKTIIYSIRVSQGSVATRSRCGGIFSDSFVA